VLDTHGRLGIAKFPSPNIDEWDVHEQQVAVRKLVGTQS
jgi:hypothetical protein